MDQNNQSGGFSNFLSNALTVFGEIRVAETQRDLELARVNEIALSDRPEHTIDQTAASVTPFFGLGGPEGALNRANLFTGAAFVATTIVVTVVAYNFFRRR